MEQRPADDDRSVGKLTEMFFYLVIEVGGGAKIQRIVSKNAFVGRPRC